MSATKLDSDNKSGSDPHSSLKDALLLLINGHPPRHVLQQAEERVKSYVQEVNEEKDAYTETFVKLEELNVIVGCKEWSPTVDPADAKNFFEEHFADMPSDPKYWGLDACDLASSRWRSEQTFSRGYGRSARYCTEIDRLYPIVTCPDTWRQYRYTTKPGKPVVMNPPPEHEVTTCCNCGSSSHIGDPMCQAVIDVNSTDDYSKVKVEELLELRVKSGLTSMTGSN
ncbi:unnamed protein product [Taenia asiatica]|uniref:CW-type domain-containing protein n=1 Tax=Taenia asiatica TaxID=60517 RepID=A0A0R3WA56_TAEAS|nr:unnamed protein product [Taenia asiatica]